MKPEDVIWKHIVHIQTLFAIHIPYQIICDINYNDIESLELYYRRRRKFSLLVKQYFHEEKGSTSGWSDRDSC